MPNRNQDDLVGICANIIRFLIDLERLCNISVEGHELFRKKRNPPISPMLILRYFRNRACCSKGWMLRIGFESQWSNNSFRAQTRSKNGAKIGRACVNFTRANSQLPITSSKPSRKPEEPSNHYCTYLNISRLNLNKAIFSVPTIC